MTIVTTSRVNLKIYGLKLNGKISCQSFVNRNASTVSLLCQNEVGKFLPNWAVKFPSLEKKFSPVRQLRTIPAGLEEKYLQTTYAPPQRGNGKELLKY